MQNRYCGDVGDFGKLGLLRFIARTGLKIGINWYLVPDEKHNSDGKHIGYQNNVIFKDCDNELLFALSDIISGGLRSVNILESKSLLPNAIYMNTIMYPPSDTTYLPRIEWHTDALKKLSGADIVFLDPDNGLLVKSVSLYSLKSNKYITKDEIIDYYKSGKSVIFYNHRSREAEAKYLNRFHDLIICPDLRGAEFAGLKFSRGTIRDYIFIMQPYHSVSINYAVKQLLESNWSRHFQKLNFQEERMT